MSFYEGLKGAVRTYLSGGAITQFDMVVGPNASGQVTVAGAGALATGIALQTTTVAAQSLGVAFDGRVMVVAAGVIANGANVSSSATGKALTSTTGQVIMGRALEAAVAGQVFTMDFRRDGTLAP